MTLNAVVFDTNVLVSALLTTDTPPQHCLDLAINDFSILFSDDTFFELERTLISAKFDRYISPDDRREYLLTLHHLATFVTIPNTLSVCPDPDDDKILETAIVGNASALITGDKGLLKLHPHSGLPILTPRQFLQEGRDNRPNEKSR